MPETKTYEQTYGDLLRVARKGDMEAEELLERKARAGNATAAKCLAILAQERQS